MHRDRILSMQSTTDFSACSLELSFFYKACTNQLYMSTGVCVLPLVVVLTV